MIGNNRNQYSNEEKLIFKARPRIFMHSKSVLIKLILIGLLIYFINPIISLTVTVQSILIEYVQVPLVQLTTTLLIFILFLLVMWAVWDLISWHFTEYMLTDQRIIVQKGVLNKKRSNIRYNKIQDMISYQSLMQRIFACGDIEIYSAHSNTTLIMENIPQPYQLENKINRMIDQKLSSTEIAREIEKEIQGEVEEEPFEEIPKPSRKPIMDRHSKKFKR